MNLIYRILIIAVVAVFAFSCVYIVTSSSDEQENPVVDPDTGEEQGVYSQNLFIEYQDGSRSDDLIGWMYHDDKIFESMTYELYITPESKTTVNMQFYYFEYIINDEFGSLVKTGQVYFSNLFNQQADGRTLVASDSFSPFDFINYTYPDGTYTFMIIPSGDILFDNLPMNLPDEFSVTVTMIDERQINIDFD